MRLPKIIFYKRKECKILLSSKVKLDVLLSHNLIDLVDKTDARSIYLILHSLTSKDKVAEDLDLEIFGTAFDLYIDNKCRAKSEVFTTTEEAFEDLKVKTPKKYQYIYEHC